MSNPKQARFLGGTIVLEGMMQSTTPPPMFQWINEKWHCEAVHYRMIWPWLQENQIQNQVPRWHDGQFVLADGRSPHDYQTESLQAWQQADKWGSIVLPTGAGKTFVALNAIAQAGASTLVVVPTIDLLHQWYARLETAFKRPIGVWYGLEKTIEAITVTTYPSAWSHAETLGNQFKLLIFDEIHHLPAPKLARNRPYVALPPIASASPPPTPTMAKRPKPQLLPSKKAAPPTHQHHSLPPPRIPRRPRPLPQTRIDELTGEQLAEYRTERIRIDLIRRRTRPLRCTCLRQPTPAMFARPNLREITFGPNWWHQFTRRKAPTTKKRTHAPKSPNSSSKRLVHQAQGKLEALEQLLREHWGQPMLIFTAHNRFAYEIARRHLIPTITHQTKAAERKAILDGFRAGQYRVIVTSKVLNEGVDVPEAKVAVVLGGSATAREYVQRLGRILRKKGNTEAILYEVIARKTVDEGMAQRRRTAAKAHVSGVTYQVSRK